MKLYFTFLLTLVSWSIYAQNGSIKGQLQDPDGKAIEFANLALYNSTDSSLIKVETSNEAGIFELRNLAAGTYFLNATYVGLPELKKTDILVNSGALLDLGVLTFSAGSIELTEATVTASRVMVEVKPDRTIFNVEGTINSTGSDAISLLRKAPGVTVDNNDNISVLGRSGVLLYVDGKRLPLTGEELSNYLQTLTADQIDRIDIISNPGAKYEAEGNAGIIDIRLKKDKNLGFNSTINGTFSKGRHARGNATVSGNYRNKTFNSFGSIGTIRGKFYNEIHFDNYQNELLLVEKNDGLYRWKNFNYRFGTDFFLAKEHTLGFILGGRYTDRTNDNLNRVAISKIATAATIDSILVANTRSEGQRNQNTYNINYRYDNAQGRSLNIDFDYGKYKNGTERWQSNEYFDASESTVLTELNNYFDTPTNIDIYTFKLDFEQKVLGGQLGIGSKVSSVVSDNSFLVFDEINGTDVQNNLQSNLFRYEENVYAGYISFARPLSDKWNFTLGLRAEQTDAMGKLEAFLPELQENPISLNYLSWFPNAGLTWQVTPNHSLALNYGRRINRPDYNVLNPFNTQLSQISFEKGNPFLRPEIVNNIELGYTLSQRYNFKFSYSKTIDQITRLIGPDDRDPRANFISWDNLAKQTVLGFNISAPAQVTKKWNAYFNLSASYLDNQADYGAGAVVDVQAFTYSIYQQHTIDLPSGFKGEVSGYFSGPGIWGGVFEYETSWSLSLGLQRKFLDNRLNIKISVDDIFYQSGWDGFSRFNGLYTEGGGRWDSRKGNISLSYNFGNQKVKSRNRKTGLENEANRVKGDN